MSWRRWDQQVLITGIIMLLVACSGASVAQDATRLEADEQPATTQATPSTQRQPASAVSADLTLAELCRSEYTDTRAPEDFLVGLVTDVGRINDGTFNQYAYEGMLAAADCFGFETTFLETAGQNDRRRNLETLLEQKPSVVVSVGYMFAEPTSEVATAHPGIQFIGVDQSLEKFPTNHVGIAFRDDQLGFLAGALAGLLTDSQTVAVVAGPDTVPPVVAMADSYEDGVAFVNDDARVLRDHLDNFSDPQAGAERAKSFIDDGADVVWGAGGETGAGAVLHAAQSGRWAIGVDQDQYYTTFQGGATDGSQRLASSVIKRADLGVFLQIGEALRGQFTGGPFVMHAANGGVTYSEFHQAELPPAVAEELEEVRLMLVEDGD